MQHLPSATTVSEGKCLEAYQTLANEGREQMMALYVECAERQMRQAAMDFDQLWEQSTRVNERPPSQMLHILDQRFDLIHAKVARHYRYRTELFRYHHQKNLASISL